MGMIMTTSRIAKLGRTYVTPEKDRRRGRFAGAGCWVDEVVVAVRVSGSEAISHAPAGSAASPAAAVWDRACVGLLLPMTSCWRFSYSVLSVALPCGMIRSP